MRLIRFIRPTPRLQQPRRLSATSVRRLAVAALVASVGLAVPASPAAAAVVGLPADVTQFSTPLIDSSKLFLLSRGLDGSILFSHGDLAVDNTSFVSYRPFFSIGGQIIGDPTAAIAPQGAQVFARDTNNQAITNLVVSYNIPTGFNVIPGLQISSEIAAVKHPDSFRGPMIRIFARGLEDGAVYTNLLVDGTPQGWVNLGGYITSEISAALMPSPSGLTVPIRLVVRGGDNRLYAMDLESVTGNVVSSWTPLGTLSAAGNPTLSKGAFLKPRGNEVFVRGSNGSIWTWDFGNPGWVNLGGKIIGDVAVSTGSDDGLNVYSRGINNAAHILRRPPGSSRYNGFVNLGGVLTGNISASGGSLNDQVAADQFITRTRENGMSGRTMVLLQSPLEYGFTEFANVGGAAVG